MDTPTNPPVSHAVNPNFRITTAIPFMYRHFNLMFYVIQGTFYLKASDFAKCVGYGLTGTIHTMMQKFLIGQDVFTAKDIPIHDMNILTKKTKARSSSAYLTYPQMVWIIQTILETKRIELPFWNWLQNVFRRPLLMIPNKGDKYVFGSFRER